MNNEAKPEPSVEMRERGYYGPCPKCGILLGFGHLPEKCDGDGRDAAFKKWCGITITDANKAPKATALVKAYKHAWDAAWQAGAASQGAPHDCKGVLCPKCQTIIMGHGCCDSK